MPAVSSFEFHDIVVNKNDISYIWQCVVCGQLTTNVMEDAPPDYCENCEEDDDRE